MNPESDLRAIHHCPQMVVAAQLWRKQARPLIVDLANNQRLTIRPVDHKIESGRRIRELRKGKGWSLTDLSLRTKEVLSRTRIQNYESGHRMVGPSEAVILAHALSSRPAYIMAVDDTQLPISQQEEKLIKNWRALPENMRMAHFRTIETEALQYRDPAPDGAARPRIPKAIAAKRRAKT
jgi:transcriptional regulator with XRE-family HTH domain